MVVINKDMEAEKNTKNLGGEMDSELVDLFSDQVRARNYKSKKALAAAVRTWVNLPEEVQRSLYTEDSPPPLDTVIEKVLLDLEKKGKLRFSRGKK